MEKDIEEFLTRERENTDIISSTFTYNDLNLRILYICNRKVLLLNVLNNNLNICWMPNIDTTNNTLGKWIPSDVYNSIKNLIKDSRNENLFSELYKHLKKGINFYRGVSGDEFKSNIKNVITNDKKYDREGHKPFYSHFKRLGRRKHGKGALLKIERNFGKEVRELFFANNITGVWTNDIEKWNSKQYFNSVDKIKEDIKLNKEAEGNKIF